MAIVRNIAKIRLFLLPVLLVAAGLDVLGAEYGGDDLIGLFRSSFASSTSIVPHKWQYIASSACDFALHFLLGQ